MADWQIVDADGHVLDNRDLIEKRLPERLRRREWSWVPRNTWDSTLGGLLGRRSVGTSEWIEALDAGGVEQSVLFPTRLLNIGFVQEREVAVALTRAYDDYLYDEYLSRSPRFLAVSPLPLQDVDAVAAELRRAVEELGMVGGMLATGGTPSRPMLGSRHWDPLYAEAERLDVPLLLHANVTNPSGPEIDPFETFIEAHTLVHPFGQLKQITSMIYQGVFERFPRLTLGCMEAGATWVPYFMDRIDEEYEKRADEAPNVPSAPSRYFREGRIYVHFEPGEALLPETLEYVGEDWFVYATDFPHWDHEFPHSAEKMRSHPRLSDQMKRKILRDNARRLYRLDRRTGA